MKALLFILSLFLFAEFFGCAYAGFVAHIPIPIHILDGQKIHFGDDWISASGSDVHLNVWLVDNWINYTVDWFSTQQVYHNHTEPFTVWIDGSEEPTPGVNWLWDAGIGVATIQATNTVEIAYNGTTITPPSTTIITGGGIVATYYMRSDSWTTNTITAYKLADNESLTTLSSTVSSYLYPTITYGVRVWIVDEWGSQIELTSGTPAAQVNPDLPYVLDGYWNCTGYDYPVSSILMKVYVQFYANPWNLQATFITQPSPTQNNPTLTPNIQTMFKLPVATWTVHYYIVKTVVGGLTSSTFYWGSNAYHTSLDLYYLPASVYEVQGYYLNTGNFIAFTLAPYSYFVGTGVSWGIIMFIFAVSLYERNPESGIVPPALILILFSGSAGLVSLAVPGIGLEVTWLFFAFAITVLLVKLVKGRGYGEP